MPVLINSKICDNSKDCGGIDVCPTHALYWDEKNKTIGIANSKCINCGACEKACPVGAIRVARTAREYNKIKKEIDADPRRVSDLFIDRYGAQPIHPAFCIPQKKFDIQIIRATQLAVVELFNNDSIGCLLKSIPIKEILKIDAKYGKIEVKDDSLLKRYGIKKLPSLLFFKDGKLVGKIEGHYESEKKEELKEKINKIISKIK